MSISKIILRLIKWFVNTENTSGVKKMTENNNKTVEELFEELKAELTFLPDFDEVKEGYLLGFKFALIM